MTPLQPHATRWYLAPLHDWQSWLVATCVIGLAGVALLAAWNRQRVQIQSLSAALSALRDNVSAVAATCLTITAVSLLGFGALDLSREQWVSEQHPQITILLDRSASVLRDPKTFRARLQSFARRLETSLRGKQPPVTDVCLMFFAASVVVENDVPVSQLAARLTDTTPLPNGTSIEQALVAARRRLSQSGGVVFLCSDGNQTTGNAEAAARQLAAQGIPVHVFPLDSPGPEVYLQHATVAATVRSGDASYVRGLVRNSSAASRRGRLTLTCYHNDTKVTPPVTLDVDPEFPAGSSVAVRHKLPFRGRGLQLAELVLTTDGGTTHTRRLHTYVQAPPRILAIGGDNRWADAVPAAWDVDQIAPGQTIDSLVRHDYDAIVISGVTSRQFPGDTLEIVAQYVRTTGTGLLLINGRHLPHAEDDETVLLSYSDTALEALLPVVPDPRKYRKEPPARKVFMLVDCSGSMRGRMHLVKRVTSHVVSVLRDEDSLQLVPFAGNARSQTWPLMDQAAKTEATAALTGLRAGGGTTPSAALQYLPEPLPDSSAIVFVSDGYYGVSELDALPDDSHSISFAIGHSRIDANDPRWRFDAAIPVDADFDANRIHLKAFEPDTRQNFFASGEFVVGNRRAAEQADILPELPIMGTAISVMHADGELVGVRPLTFEPVLAFRDVDRARIAVFTSGIPDLWIHQPAGRAAITHWIREISTLEDASRYVIAARDAGNRLELNMAVQSTAETPDVSALAVTVVDQGRIRETAILRPAARGLLRGHLRLPDADKPQTVFLVIREDGDDALSRPQRIPAILPPPHRKPVHDGREDWAYGTDWQTLRAVQQAGGGLMLNLTDEWPVLNVAASSLSQTQFWPFLGGLSVVLFVVAMFVQTVFVHARRQPL